MGYYTDGVSYYIYDDNANFGGGDAHVAGTPHSCADFFASFPLVLAEMQDALGNKTAPGVAFLLTVNTVFGGKTGVDGFNTTTWLETASRFIFTKPGVSLTIRNQGATPNAFINWGRKIGSGDRMSGHTGVSYFQPSGNITLQQNVNAYGSRIEALAGTIQVTDAAVNNSMEFAATHFMANQLLVFGGSGQGIKARNLHATSSRSGSTNFVNNAEFAESSGIYLGAVGTNIYAMQTAGVAKKPRGVIFSSDQSDADIRLTGAGSAWYFVAGRRSSAPLLFSKASGGPVDLNGFSANRTVVEAHLRVMNAAGVPIPGIPVKIDSDGLDPTSSITGATLTNIEGDISWNHSASGTPNGLPVRSQGLDASNNTLVADRTITISVNLKTMAGWNPAYPSRVVRITGPGRDMNHGTPQASFGDYYPFITIPIVLDFTSIPGEWEKCEV